MLLKVPVKTLGVLLSNINTTIADFVADGAIKDTSCTPLGNHCADVVAEGAI